MDAHSKTFSSEKIDASAQSERPFSLPSWAELLTAVPKTYAHSAEIFGEQEPLEYLYKVVSGAVRTFKVLGDGRRHVAAFYLPGEFFGLELGKTYMLSAEAITNSKILRIKHSVLKVLAENDRDVANRLREMTHCKLRRVQAHATLLAKTANERVADFLLEMAARRPGASQTELPMSRQDIADHLGLTIETISRIFTKFEADAVIAIPNTRCVILLDRVALVRLGT
jgi:CRP-like cAMP-binding protein